MGFGGHGYMYLWTLGNATFSYSTECKLFTENAQQPRALQMSRLEQARARVASLLESKRPILWVTY